MKFKTLILTALLLFTPIQTVTASFFDDTGVGKHQSAKFNRCCCGGGYYCDNEYGCHYDDECGKYYEGCYRR